MVDFLGIASMFWRPEIAWIAGAFDFRTVAVLFGISFAFAFVVDLILGNPKFRLFAVVTLIPVIAAWILLYSPFMGLAGMEVAGGFGLFREVGSVFTGHMGTIVTFLVVWSLFELAVTLGLMRLVSVILHNPLEAHIDAWIVAPLMEEYAFRWVLMGMLLGWGVSVELAILVQAIVFAISHVKNGIVHGLDSWVGIASANITVPLGFTLGFVALNYGLLYAFLLHVVFNFIFDILNIVMGGGGK